MDTPRVVLAAIALLCGAMASIGSSPQMTAVMICAAVIAACLLIIAGPAKENNV
jgi:hypothetical protein